MNIELRKGDFVETLMVSHGKEFRNRGKVVFATREIVVVTLNTLPFQKPTGTTSETLRYSIGWIEGKGHMCAEVLSISYNQFLVLWNIDS